MPQKFVNLENLTSFWGNAKEYISNERKEIEDQLYNWQKTEKAPLVQCEPVSNSELHPIVEFKFKETLPEGEKGPDNPSVISGINSVKVVRGAENIITYEDMYVSTALTSMVTAQNDGSILINGTIPTGGGFIFRKSGTYNENSNVVDGYSTFIPEGTYRIGLKIESGSITFNSGYVAIRFSCKKNIEDSTYIYRDGSVTMSATSNLDTYVTRTIPEGGAWYSWLFVLGSTAVGTNCVIRPYVYPVLDPINDKDTIISNNFYTINLNNTYYGGSIDFSTGKMTITDVSWILDENFATTMEAYNSITGYAHFNRYSFPNGTPYKHFPNNANVNGFYSCSHFPTISVSHYQDVETGSVAYPNLWFNPEGTQMRISAPFSTVTNFQTWLGEQKTAGTPVTLVYKLNTPFTINLSSQQIKSLPSLEGTSKRINTIYTDADSVQVEYQKYVGIDSTLDSNSVNAIQNKVVNSALNTKANDSETVHLTGNEQIAGVKEFISSPQVPVPAANNDAVPMIWVKDMLRTEVEKLTDSRNTIVRDSNDNPHYMVVIPRFNIEDAFDTTAYGTGVHDMFKIGDKVASEILIGKYHCTKLTGDVAATLPHANPWTNINFDNAVTVCRALGTNFALCPDIVYAGYVLKMAKTLGDSYQYHGNTNYGRDSVDHSQTGTFATATELSYGDTGISDPVTLTGSGPKEWYSDGTFLGVADLAGNIIEWTSGLRIVDGEFQFIPNNDSMLSTIDFSVNSTDWKAVLSDGSFVTPGTADTIKGDGNAADTRSNWSDAGTWNLNTVLVNQNVNGYYIGNFSNIAVVSGITVPSLFVRAGILPYSGATTKLCNWFAMCNKGERFAHRGSNWSSSYGPLRTGLNGVRTNSGRIVGFRLAFCAFS